MHLVQLGGIDLVVPILWTYRFLVDGGKVF